MTKKTIRAICFGLIVKKTLLLRINCFLLEIINKIVMTYNQCRQKLCCIQRYNKLHIAKNNFKFVKKNDTTQSFPILYNF